MKKRRAVIPAKAGIQTFFHSNSLSKSSQLGFVRSIYYSPKSRQLKLPWDEIIRDLSAMRAVVVRLNGDRYLMRPSLKGHAGALFQITGVKVPPLAQPL
ncbi:MAG: hypothetical protein HY747_10875 [Elusimicrobia bacterium]|nr:hypothetical protein [Elusimicrobiota bacterium]